MVSKVYCLFYSEFYNFNFPLQTFKTETFGIWSLKFFHQVESYGLNLGSVIMLKLQINFNDQPILLYIITQKRKESILL